MVRNIIKNNSQSFIFPGRIFASTGSQQAPSAQLITAVMPQPIINQCCPGPPLLCNEVILVGRWQPPLADYGHFDLGDSLNGNMGIYPIVGGSGLTYQIAQIDICPPFSDDNPYLEGKDYDVCQLNCQRTQAQICIYSAGTYFVQVRWDGLTNPITFALDYGVGYHDMFDAELCSKEEQRRTINLPFDTDLFISCQNWGLLPNNAKRLIFQWDDMYGSKYGSVFKIADGLAQIIQAIKDRYAALNRPINVVLSGHGTLNVFFNSSSNLLYDNNDQTKFLGTQCNGMINKLLFFSCCTALNDFNGIIDPNNQNLMMLNLAKALYNNTNKVFIYGFLGVVTSQFASNRRAEYVAIGKSDREILVRYP